jgi:hypothetical protein
MKPAILGPGIRHRDPRSHSRTSRRNGERRDTPAGANHQIAIREAGIT